MPGWDEGGHKPTARPAVWTVVRPSVLFGGTPRRLSLQAGKWVLEVVRHVNLGQDLIRPTTQRLTGQRAIASYFKSNPDKALLAKATHRLMQTEPADQSRSYTAEGVDWIANSTPPPRGDRLDSYRPPAEPPSLDTRVSELEGRVVVLTAVQEGLLLRLARLEAKLANGEVVPRARRPARGELRPGTSDELGDLPALDESSPGADSEEEEASDMSDGAAAGARAGRGRGRRGRAGRAPSVDERDEQGEQDEQDEQEGEPEAQEDAEDAAEPGHEKPAVPEEPVSPPRSLLTLPPIYELAKCVSLLIGGDVSAKEGDPPLGVNRTTANCYAAPILDDNDQCVGMILMDLKATVYLGGTLMMLPRSELDQQLRSFTPGEDSIAASAEICNALSGAINGFQNQHVRVGGLEKFELESWRWVTKPADRRDLEDSFGGRTALFTRPPPVQIG